MGSARMFRTSWDDASWLFPPTSPKLTVALSYGSFSVSHEFGGRFGSYYVLGVKRPIGGASFIVPARARRERQLSIEAVADEIDLTLRPPVLNSTLLAEDVCSIFRLLDSNVVGPAASTYARNQATLRSRRNCVRRLRETLLAFETENPFARAGVPSLESGWLAPPSSGLKRRWA